MHFPSKILIILAFGITFSGLAQDDKLKQSITLSTEMFGAVLDGYVVEGGYNIGKWRIAAMYSSVELPEFYNAQSDDFFVNRDILDISFTRFLNDKQNGFHYGLGVGYFLEERVEYLESGLTLTKDFVRINARVGYFWQPFQKKDKWYGGFFIEPCANIGFAVNDTDLTFPADVYDGKLLHISGPMFNFGYKFDLHK